MRPLRVLLVEDAELDAQLVLRELGRGDYDVTHLRVDTLAALRDALREHAWDLVVTDFSLPGFSAMEVLKNLGAGGLDLPCIVISGSIEEEAAVDAMKLGAGDFVGKQRMARLLPAVSRELREAADRRARRTAEAALGEAKERMRFALEAAGVGTWEWAIGSGQTIWSDVFERLHGMPVGSFRGTFDAFVEAIHPDDRQGVLDHFNRSLKSSAESRLEYRVIWPDSSEHWMASVGRVFFDEAGQPERAAGVGMDITTQKTLEQQFRQAQKMESIGNLAGGIAHDFNNLLSVILGYSNLLIDDIQNDPALHRLKTELEEIRKAGESATTLTSQLLAFSRKQIIQPEVLNINAIVQPLEPMLRRLIGEDVELTARLPIDLASVKADAGQIEQVIMNLVVNARDALPSGGKITIETANIHLDEAYARGHITVVPGPYVMLAVSDNGVGMAPEVQARIFEPFFTTKPKGRGTGLGLATVYGIVKQNGGNVWVYSEPGKGTTFKVYLPRTREAAESPTPGGPANTFEGDETILLVEDDDRVRRLAKEVLLRHGYFIIEASDAERALSAAAAHPRHIHLLLTDVVMPSMSGRVLAQTLTGRYPRLKVLFMSGYTDNAIVHHGVLEAGVAFIQKPFTPTTLARAVREALDGPASPA